VNHKKLLSNDRITQVFKMFDKDGNGSISKQEIKDFFSMQDQNEDFVKELINEVDANGDGEVSNRYVDLLQ
jgi:calcium-dependent protein kinase